MHWRENNGSILCMYLFFFRRNMLVSFPPPSDSGTHHAQETIERDWTLARLDTSLIIR